MEKLDYKKEYKDLYLPKNKPVTVLVPRMSFIMVDGQGDPNAEGGEFKQAVELLYAIAYTIKMSKLGRSVPDGYIEYVMPPLEGLWTIADGSCALDCRRKDELCWTAMIRQPEFVTYDVFNWACGEVRQKKGLDTSNARFQTYSEGLCVQCMHCGSYDDEPATIKLINSFIELNGLAEDFASGRRHHEIYISNPLRTKAERLKTVLRLPVRKD